MGRAKYSCQSVVPHTILDIANTQRRAHPPVILANLADLLRLCTSGDGVVPEEEVPELRSALLTMLPLCGSAGDLMLAIQGRLHDAADASGHEKSLWTFIKLWIEDTSLAPDIVLDARAHVTPM